MVKKTVKKMKNESIETVKTKQNNKKKGPFLQRLFFIIKDPENYNLIHWNKEGTHIIITDPINFSKKIIPEYFKHDNYASFVRQLCYYGFGKETNIINSKSEVFFNEFFQKNMGLEEVIKKIKRKTSLKENKEEIKENDNSIKEPILIYEQDKTNDDIKKIFKFKNLIKKDNFNIKENKNILEFLIKKNQEGIYFYQKKLSEMQELNKNLNNLQIMQNLNRNINNKYLININEENKIKNEDKSRQNIIVHKESFTLNENKKLTKAFKNTNINRIEKNQENENFYISSDEEYNKLVEYPKKIHFLQKSTSSLLNKTIFVNASFANNQNISLLKNQLMNSFQ